MKGRMIMKKKKRRLVNILMKILLLLGLYLMIVTFGIKPAARCIKILRDFQGWISLWQIFKQSLIILFGESYTMFAMYIVYMVGRDPLEDNQDLKQEEQEYKES